MDTTTIGATNMILEVCGYELKKPAIQNDRSPDNAAYVKESDFTGCKIRQHVCI